MAGPFDVGEGMTAPDVSTGSDQHDFLRRFLAMQGIFGLGNGNHQPGSGGIQSGGGLAGGLASGLGGGGMGGLLGMLRKNFPGGSGMANGSPANFLE